MESFGRLIIIFGVLMVIVGIIFSLFGKLPFFGKLPGDILIKRENFTFYAPIATSILVSIILTIILNLLSNLRR